MLRRLKILTITLVTLGLSGACFGSTPGAEAARAATKALPSVLAGIPPGQEANFGFHDRGEFAGATVGDPYQVITFTLGPGRVLNLVRQRDWRVPVRVHGQARALLTVVEGESGWEAVDFGAAGLARELQHQEEALTGKPTFRHRFILRLYQHWADFLVLSHFELPADDDLAIPLFQAESAVGLAGKTGRHSVAEIGRQVWQRLATTQPEEE